MFCFITCLFCRHFFTITGIYFKSIPVGDPVILNFQFTNAGNAPLKIKNVAPGCECSVASFDTGYVMPGNVAGIKVVYRNHNDTGSVIKNLVVESNSKEPLTVLYFQSS